jgi:hypothetical protein
MNLHQKIKLHIKVNQYIKECKELDVLWLCKLFKLEKIEKKLSDSIFKERQINK